VSKISSVNIGYKMETNWKYDTKKVWTCPWGIFLDCSLSYYGYKMETNWKYDTKKSERVHEVYS